MAKSMPFTLSGPFDIYVSGNLFSDGNSLRLENLSSHQTVDIHPDTNPGLEWQRCRFELPPGLKGKELRIVAEDQSKGAYGWVAFSGPLPPIGSPDRLDAKGMLLDACEFVALLFLPGFTAAAFAIVFGIRGIIKPGLILLGGMAAPGYFIFFSDVMSPPVGSRVSVALPIVSSILLTASLIRYRRSLPQRLRPFLLPMVLTWFASMATLSLGFLYGGTSATFPTTWVRFTHPLPPDNTIPYLLAEVLQKGPSAKPLIGDWLSSDRPPLQAGMILALEPWMSSLTSRELCYQTASVIIQTLWIPAMWLLLYALRARPLTRAVVIATAYFSGFAIVNSFYVWPKLLAAAYGLAFAIPILSMRSRRSRPKWLVRGVLGFLLACSLLAHGGTVFAVLGLSMFLLTRFSGHLLKETCLVGLIAILFYLPWSAYQKYVDPPGDRLLKMHLAGVDAITKESALTVIANAYRSQTFGTWIAAKRADAEAVFGHEVDYFERAADFSRTGSITGIRALEFTYCLPATGFAALGILSLFLRGRKSRNRRELRSGERLILWALASSIAWILLMYVPARTVVHQGAYAMLLAAIAGSMLLLRSTAPVTGVIVCILQCGFHLLVYAPDTTRLTSPNSLVQSMNLWMLGLLVCSLCGFVGALLADCLSEDTATPTIRRPVAAGPPVAPIPYRVADQPH